jgi:hypothetical protein
MMSCVSDWREIDGKGRAMMGCIRWVMSLSAVSMLTLGGSGCAEEEESGAVDAGGHDVSLDHRSSADTTSDLSVDRSTWGDVVADREPREDASVSPDHDAGEDGFHSDRTDDPLIDHPDRTDNPLIDRAADREDGPSCQGDTAWKAGDDAFTLSIDEGPSSPPPNAACTGRKSVTTFSITTRTLSQIGCLAYGPVERAAVLAAPAVDRIVAELERLRTTCGAPCGAEGTTATLVIRDGAGCVARAYDSDSARCEQAQLPPFVAMGDLARLNGLLDATLTGICNTTTGTSDAGTCRIEGEGGTSRVCRSASGTVEAGTDARADARDATDASDGDGEVCVREPILTATSAVSIAIGGGLPPPPPPDGGCQTIWMSYFFSLQTKTLTESGCIANRNVRRQIELSDEQSGEITAALSNMQSSCERYCLPDPNRSGLSAFDCNGTSQKSYGSDDNVNCSTTPAGPPYMRSGDLWSLGQLLSRITASACGPRPDAAAPGACRSYCREVVR